MRPAIFTPEDIIEAGKALQTEGCNITGFALRKKVGGGDPNRLRQVWDEYQARESVTEHDPVAELPAEVADEMKAASAALTERIAQVTVGLNDKAVRAAERRVAEVTRAAGEQTAQAERELADAVQTVDDLEENLDALRDEHINILARLDDSRAKEQSQAIELAQLRERLCTAEKRLKESEKTGEDLAKQHNQQLSDMQKRLDAAEAKVTEATTRHAAELRNVKDLHLEEISGLKERLAAMENAATVAAEKTESNVKAMTEKHATELKACKVVMAEAQKEATSAREAKAELMGELKSLKEQNSQFAALLAGKGKPEA